MYCKHCGNQIDDDSVFCSHCGKQVSENNISIKDTSTQQNQVEDIISSPSAQHLEKKSEKQKREDTASGNSSKNLLFFCAGFVLIALIVWGLYPLLFGKRIADITIDKVSEDLAKATQRYDRLYGFHEGLARVEKDKRFGFIDKLGKEIIPCKYDDADDFYNGLAVVKIGEKKGAINQDDKFAIPCIYKYLEIFKDSTVRASLDDKEGLLNYNGKTIIPFEYELCKEFREGLALVEKDGLYGFVDKSGVVVIPCLYENTYDCVGFSEGLAGVKRDGKWGYIDKTGKVVLPFDDSLTGMPFSSGRSTIYRGGLTITMDSNGNPIYTRSPFEMAIINKKGEQVSKWHRGEIGAFENGYAIFTDERGFEYGHLGLIDCNANVIVPCLFESMNLYSLKKGLIWVSQGTDKDGYYDINANSFAIPCTYDIWPEQISEGLVAAKKDGKSGYVSISNEEIIPFIYDDTDNFSEGFGVVKRYGKYGYVDRYGNDTFSTK